MRCMIPGSTPIPNGARVFVLASFALSFIKFRHRLLQAIRAAGATLHLAAPDFPTQSGVRERLSEMDCRFHDVPMSRTGINPLRDILTFLCLVRVMVREKPSHFLGYTAKPVIYGLLAARIARVPHRTALITGLGYLFAEPRSGLARLVQSCGSRLYRLALAQATMVIFQNEDDRNLFTGHGLVPVNRTAVVNGSGVPLDEFAAQPLPRDDGRCHFLLLARLLCDKGIREYVQAARMVRMRHPNAVFHLAGWIDDHPSAIGPDELQSWIDEGVVAWHGKLDDVRASLGACHVYVLPSYREGTPRTVLEAMASGRPVITTDAPGCRQTVVHGKTGLLVPVRDVQALANGFEHFLDHPECIAVMGHQARLHAERHYDVNVVNCHMLELMGSAAGEEPARRAGLVLKRVFDLLTAATLMLALAPLLLGIAMLVRFRLGTPILFRQQRPGKHGKPFTLYKFRSMTDARDEQGCLLPDAVRLTPFGAFLRKSSLDELPELYNVLRGEMSLVGPRPLLMRYVAFFTERERLRFELAPGITGWAQINGRNETGWTTRLARDVWYVENRSIWLDLKILLRTAVLVVRRDGVVVDASSVMRDLDEERRHQGAES